MTSCFGLRGFGASKRAEKGSRMEKEEAFGPSPSLSAFPNINNLYRDMDSNRGSETFIRQSFADNSIQENEKETKIDLEAAIRAVDIALSGLDIGGRKQIPSPNLVRPLQEHRTSPDVMRNSRPGFPPRAVPKVFHRLKKAWNSNPQHKALQDALSSMRQTGSFSSYQTPGDIGCYGSSELIGGNLGISQFSNFYGGSMDHKNAAYNTTDLQGFYNMDNESYNLQCLQNLLSCPTNLSNSFTAGCNYGPPNSDFCAGLQNQKLAFLQSGVNELLMNSGDSFSSRISVPYHQSYRGDSFSSKIEFPISNDSFTSKFGLSLNGDSFTSQRADPCTTPHMAHKPEEQFMDTAFSLPESVVADLESLADGNVKYELPDLRPGIQMDPKTKSEQALLVAIAGILKCVLEGNLKAGDLLSDLNFLIVSLRRHLSDYCNLSSNAAETFCSVVRTLPIVCRSANVNSDIVSSLQRFLVVLSSGHPILKNSASCLANYDPKDTINESQQSEARHLLTRIHRKLTGGHRSNGVQHVARALYESSGEVKDIVPGNERHIGTPKSHAKFLLDGQSSRSSGDSLTSFDIERHSDVKVQEYV